jgi:hypothetical protein
MDDYRANQYYEEAMARYYKAFEQKSNEVKYE